MSSNKTKPKETGDSKETLLGKVSEIDNYVKKLETRVSVLESSRTDTGDISKEVRLAMNREPSVILFNLPERNDDKSSIKYQLINTNFDGVNLGQNR